MKSKKSKKSFILSDFWDVTEVSESGILKTKNRFGFIFEVEGLDGSFLSPEQAETLHNDWRSVLRLPTGEEMQIIYRKRVEFSKWVEDQLSQAFLSNNSYGRKILLDQLADQVSQMSKEEPQLLSQKIIICYWTKDLLESEDLEEKRQLFIAQLSAFGFQVNCLDKVKIEREINISTQDLNSSELQTPEWPSIKIEAGQLFVNDDIFRSLELNKLPESFTELGMIQSITQLPYPMDVCVRLFSREANPIISQLERKRNLLNAQKTSKNSPSPVVESQMDQIDQVLRSLADKSESIFEMKMTVGLRFPKKLASFHRKALADVLRSASQMDFCEFVECTLGTYDSYLECIPSFTGKNISTHTVLASNAIHFLPFFRPSRGDRRQVVTFQSRNTNLYGIDPVDSRLANYNWLVSGTSGSGKSFFVNSLLAQSISIDPQIFIVDIGGSYNKLTQFLGGQVMSLEPGQGFELSPFFLSKSEDPKEERMRRQHIFQIFLEMTRMDGNLPPIEVRHLLSNCLDKLLNQDQLPEHPITSLIDIVSKVPSKATQTLILHLKPWGSNSFYAQFLDNNKVIKNKETILTFDLKGLTEFEDLSRVVQLIICASLWARIRQVKNNQFSWIVLDEVAFSLLKTQPLFVDELVSTLRKYFAGVVIVVQDLEKITSSLAGSSILQNTQSKAILQQRGNPKNYSHILSLSQMDQWAIESLRREKGVFSDVFLIRDSERTVIRHVPSSMEYWLATSAPEDNQVFKDWMSKSKGDFSKNVLDFVSFRNGALQ
ncbi:MAG: DUF87 domain-containing protein [Bdellovibrionaceae bacterium]|nr:DUF87 domain-containing protein [Pseudobdellovibrionaceae bacterium]